jgi:TPR repeat protein
VSVLQQIAPRDADQKNNYLRQRIDADDPVAMTFLGNHLHFIKHDDDGALEMWNKAAALGDAEAYLRLAVLYIKRGENSTKRRNKRKVPS